MIKIEKFVVNPLQENSFVVSDETGECIFIDPGFYYEEEFDEVKEYISANSLSPVKIVNTHCHFDHIMGVEFIRDEYKIPFEAHPDDAFWVERAVEQGQMFGFDVQPVQPVDNFFHEGENIKFGNTSFEIIHVPGHSPGHVVFFNRENAVLIGGDYATLISAIKNKLFLLPDGTKVYCGHGTETTLGFEKQYNPFLT